MNQCQVPFKNTNQIRKEISKYKSGDDPEIILSEVGNGLAEAAKNGRDPDLMATMSDFKALTLNEFSNGTLMTEVIPDKYRTFAIEMLRKLQQDYNCQTVAEKALAELATINYIRTLDLQERIMESLSTQKSMSYSHNSCERDLNIGHVKSLNACERTFIELKFLNILSKEYDRANRQFLMAIQTLKMMKQPPLKVSIRTESAVFGQNQIIQTNGHG